MKLITLEKVADVLEFGKNEVFVGEERRKGANLPLTNMLKLGK